MENFISTERLNLRMFNYTDVEFVIELLNSPEWIKYIGERNVKNIEQAQAFIDKMNKSHLEFGFGFYVVEQKDTKIRMGMCGLVKRDFLENPDIGFAFLSRFTGNGYAYEISSAFMKYAIEELKIPKIFAIAVPYNLSSIKLLEKMGMKYKQEINIPTDNELLHLFQN